MARRILITGITGFAGSHLAEYVLREHPEFEVCGTWRWRSRMENVSECRDKVRLIECDLRDPVAVRRTLEEVRPERIFHLAAQSFVPASWASPLEALDTNIHSTLHLLETMRSLGLKDTWLQIACSSEEYGLVHPDETPIAETNPLRPLSPYAVSKVAQDYLGYQYQQSYGLKTVRTRGFNHTGPRRGEVFVTSNFSRQVALIEKGKQAPVVKVGNLEARRDFTDVRDMVRGYWLATDGGCTPGEVYNIGTGRDVTIQWVLDTLVSYAKVKVTVEQEASRMRPSDVQILCADNSKFARATGWAPSYTLEQTLLDLLNYWRERV